LPVKKYTWDVKAVRYRAPSGRFVKRSDVLKAFRRGTEAGQRRAQLLNGLASSDVTLWQQALREQVKLAHLQAAALGKGGVKQLTQSDYGRLGAELKYQYQRLDLFAQAIARGEIDTSSPKFAARVNAYFNAAQKTYWTTTARVHDAAGYMVRNVPSPLVEHCQASAKRPGVPGCEEETEKGLVTLSRMSMPGTRVCVTGCACVLRFEMPGR
jgi:hypothetical protein